MIYVVAIEHPIYLQDGLLVNNIYNIEICNGIILTQHLGWVIELEANNTITVSFEEVESAYNNFIVSHTIETNMDDVNCIYPGGRANDKDISNTINIVQSIDGKMVYVCDVTSNLALLSSVAWR